MTRTAAPPPAPAPVRIVQVGLEELEMIIQRRVEAALLRQGRYSDKRMAAHLEISTRAWRGEYRSDPGLLALAIPLRRVGQQRQRLRWPVLAVEEYLRTRGGGDAT